MKVDLLDLYGNFKVGIGLCHHLFDDAILKNIEYERNGGHQDQ